MLPIWAPLVVQLVKNLPEMWKTRVWSLGQEGPMEKEMAIHSSSLAWRIPGTEEPGQPQSVGLQRIGHNRATTFHVVACGHHAVCSIFRAYSHSSCITETLYPLTYVSSYLPPPSPQPLETTILTPCFCEFVLDGTPTWDHYNTCLSASSLFHWAQCLPGAYMLLQVGLSSPFFKTE